MAGVTAAGPFSVLVVDDEMGPRMAVQMLLAEDHRVYTAADVASAREILEQEKIDLVLSDIRMPGETGVDLLRYVRKNHSNVELILLTGFGELSTAKEAVQLGAYAYLEKPFDNVVLLEHVTGALVRRQAERDRRRLERLAMEANRFELLGRVVSGLIHDMGSPLSVAGTQLELVLANASLLHDRDRLEGILGQVAHCSDLVRSALGFLREHESEDSEFTLEDIATSTLQLAEPLVRNQRVEVANAYNKSASPVRGDFVLVRQAILNLVNNACQAMEGQTVPQRLLITTWTEDRYACLAVGDSGKGIPESDRQRVFESFYTTKGENGTGLGLAAVRNIMHRHEGEVSVGESPDGGAQFVLKFPMAS